MHMLKRAFPICSSDFTDVLGAVIVMIRTTCMKMEDFFQVQKQLICKNFPTLPVKWCQTFSSKQMCTGLQAESRIKMNKTASSLKPYMKIGGVNPFFKF